MKWFRQPVRCEDDFAVFLLVWGWIGVAHSENWYAEVWCQ